MKKVGMFNCYGNVDELVGRYVGCFRHINCHGPNIGLVTKVRAWKGVGQECNLGVTFTFSGMQENARE